MFRKDPISIEGPMGQTFLFTCRYRHDDYFGHEHVAFPPYRVYAKQCLNSLVAYSGNDPFNYALFDVWQMVFQKPWTRPRNTDELINDLADKVHRGDLHVYRTLRQVDEELRRSGGNPEMVEEDWWDTTKGFVKGFANDLIRRNAAMNREWLSEKGIVKFRERTTGRELSSEEVGQRYEQDGKDYFPLESQAQREGAEMVDESRAALIAAEAVMLIGTRGRNVLRDPEQFAADLKAALINARSETEALGKAGLEQAKRRLGHTTDSRYVDRYHGPDDMTSRDGRLTEWEAKGNNRDSTTVATDRDGNLQGSRLKNARRARRMSQDKASKVDQPSQRQGGPYLEDEIDLWDEVFDADGEKQHMSVHTNTETGRVQVFERDQYGNIERQVDDFKMENFDEMRSAIEEGFRR